MSGGDSLSGALARGAVGLAATARAYAKIIDEVNQLDLSELVPKVANNRRD